ncbi:MAG: hypothetical protein HZB44_09115 [Actinobacteria bacterium]|nr:hypothetical protein [Actinomycetota bacterium]
MRQSILIWQGRHPGWAAVLAVACIVIIAALAAGCDGGGETTVTVEKTVSVGAAPSGSAPAEKDAYRNTVNDLTRRADQMNTDFRALIDRYNEGQSNAEELSAWAEQDWRAYEEMSGQLTAMKVPEEFREAHPQLISGFNKWQAAFEAYRNGFRDNSRAELDKARDFDNEAVIEVNQAVNRIAQVE